MKNQIITNDGIARFIWGDGSGEIVEAPVTSVYAVFNEDTVSFILIAIPKTGGLSIFTTKAEDLELNGRTYGMAELPDAVADAFKPFDSKSSLKEIYLGTEYDTVDPTSGDIHKYQVGDEVSGHTITEDDFHYLIYVYVNDEDEYTLTAIDMEEFLTEQEFRSGTTVINHIVRGVVDPRSEMVYTAYTSASTPSASADVLTVNESGFTVHNIQTAINEKAKAAIKKVEKQAEYVWDSTKQKMVLKLYDQEENELNSIEWFDTLPNGDILLPNRQF